MSSPKVGEDDNNNDDDGRRRRDEDEEDEDADGGIRESGKKVARREGIQEVEFLGALLNLAGVHERGEGSTPTLGCKAGTHDLPGQS